MARMKATPEERFFAKVVQPETCWTWTGATNNAGYGVFNPGSGGTKLAHRWIYEYLVAEIPDGLTLDHLCRNPPCVNPEHLEPVPVGVNARRGDHSKSRLEFCMLGLHQMVDANIITRPSKPGSRECRACANEKRRGRRALAAVNGERYP